MFSISIITSSTNQKFTFSEKEKCFPKRKSTLTKGSLKQKKDAT